MLHRDAHAAMFQDVDACGLTHHMGQLTVTMTGCCQLQHGPCRNKPSLRLLFFPVVLVSTPPRQCCTSADSAAATNTL